MLPALVSLELAAGDGDALGGDHAEGAVGEMVDFHGVHGAGDVGGFSGGHGLSLIHISEPTRP